MKKPTDIHNGKAGLLGRLFGINKTNTLKVNEDKNVRTKTPRVDATTPRHTETEIKAIMGRASRNVGNNNAEFFSNLSRANLVDELTDEQASRFTCPMVTEGIEQRPPGQDLKIITQDITTLENINPKWLRISDLPGYMQQAIRALGRQVFRQFTQTSIEEIDIISTVTHEEIEVRAVMAWISKNGIRDDQAKIDFSRFMMGMESNTQVWNTPEHTWLMVQDPGGYYIYRWTGGRAVSLPSRFTAKQIKQIENLDFDENEPF